MRTKILVVGPNEAATQLVVRGILGPRAAEDSTSSPAAAAAAAAEGASHKWSIDNKYYTAVVELVPHASLSPSAAALKGLHAQVDAVVCILNRRQHSGRFVDIMDRWADFLDACDPAVSIVASHSAVSDESDGTGAATAAEDAIESWCLDHSFEFVDLEEKQDEDEPAFSAFGIDRIRESLQSVMWPNMVRKKPQTKQTETAANEDAFPTEGEIQKMQEKIFSTSIDDDDEEDFSLENAFDLIKGLREQAGQMEESERKKLAELVALSFWKKMGGSDGDFNLEE